MFGWEKSKKNKIYLFNHVCKIFYSSFCTILFQLCQLQRWHNIVSHVGHVKKILKDKLVYISCVTYLSFAWEIPEEYCWIFVLDILLLFHISRINLSWYCIDSFGIPECRWCKRRNRILSHMPPSCILMHLSHLIKIKRPWKSLS